MFSTNNPLCLIWIAAEAGNLLLMQQIWKIAILTK